MAKLNDMPFEILGLIIQNLDGYSMKLFSLVNRQCRAATTSKLFRAIKIEFSRCGMRKLEGVANSLFAPFVKVLHYEASELLDPSIEHWEYFTSWIYTPEEYARDQMDFRWDLRGKDFSYRKSHLYFRSIASSQNGIMQQRDDIRIFSECLPRLPSLKKIELSFNGAKEDQRLWFANRLFFESRDSFPIHLEAVLNGMVTARRNGVLVESLRVEGMRLGAFLSAELMEAAFVYLRELTLVDSPDLITALSSFVLPSLRRLELKNCRLSESTLLNFLKINGYIAQHSHACGNEALQARTGSSPENVIQRLRHLVIIRDT